MKRMFIDHCPVRIVQLTDLHLLGDPGEALRGIPVERNLNAVLDAAAGDLARADLVLLTGDLAEAGEPAAYARLARAVAARTRRCFALPGNHDDPVHLANALPATGRDRVAVCRLGRWRLLLLDSTLPGRSAGHLDRRQLHWLEAQLGGASRDPVLVILHHPPLPIGSAWLDAIGLRNGAALRSVLERAASRIRAVLFGHIHQAFDRRRGGLRYLATPATGVQFVPGTRRPGIDILPPGWRELLLYPDGRLVTRVKRLTV